MTFYPLVFAVSHENFRGGTTARIVSTPLPFALRPAHFRMSPKTQLLFLIESAVASSGSQTSETILSTATIPEPVPDWAFNHEALVDLGFPSNFVLPPGAVITLKVKNIYAGALSFWGVLLCTRENDNERPRPGSWASDLGLT